MRVLLIEGDKNFRHDLAVYLDQMIPGQVDFSSADSATEAFKILDAEKFDVVLLDLTLPDSENPEMTLDSFKRIMEKCPTIIITRFDDFDLGIQAIGNGARDIICKTELDKLTTVLGVLNRKG